MTHNYKTNRKIATITSIILVIALLLTGTYAYQSISQQALNQAIGKAAPAGGRLHDDFEMMGENYGEKEWRKDVSANKDIYVENFEDQDGRDIFLRVKLYEYMEVGQGAHLHPGETGFDLRTALPLIAGANREDVTTWSPRLPGDDANSNLFREYWDWNMGGQKDYMPTFNKDPMSKESDVKGHAVDPQALQNGELPNTTRRDTNPMGTHAYPEAAGLHDYFTTNSTKEAQVKYWDWNLNNGDGEHAITTTTEEHTAKPTLNANIVLIEDWDETIGDYWVLDKDGWCYWAAPLSPETATGLLLNSITLIQVPDQEWYYGIYVDAQMATADEINPAFYGDDAQSPTFEAKDLLSIITGNLAPAIMRQVLHTTSTDDMFMESDVRNDDVRTFEVLDLNMNRVKDEADLVENFNVGGGYRGVQLAGARDLTHSESESKVFVFWDVNNNFYLAGKGGVHATGSLGHMFSATPSMTTVNLSNLDTSNVIHMNSMFNGASGLTTLDLSSLNTSKVITMNSMFNGANGLTTLDLSDFNTLNVTTMQSMFANMGALTSLNLSGLDTSNVAMMNHMFQATSSLATLDLSHFNTSKVVDMQSMFNGASSLTSLDLSNFDTSSVNNMRRMFYRASGLTSLDLSGWDTSDVTNMAGMFHVASSLSTLDLSHFDTSNVTTMQEMFRSTEALENLDLSSFDTSKVTNTSWMFRTTTALQTIDFRNATFGAVTDSEYMFSGSGINNIIVHDQDAANFVASTFEWPTSALITIAQ